MAYDFLRKHFEDEVVDKLEESLSFSPTRAIIFDENKISKETLKLIFPLLEDHPYLKNALIDTTQSYNLGKTLLHELGAYYIMDSSAMLVSYFLDVKDDDFVLDMCAAPGGKSIALSLLNPRCYIVSNDISRSRQQETIKNIERMGLSNICVTLNDLTNLKLDKPTFDKIILDAPCSGSGMFRKEKKMLEDFSLEKIKALLTTQEKLLEKAYALLKPGGELIYSTCSFSYEENEGQIIPFLNRHEDMHILDIDHSPHFYHHKDLPFALHVFFYLFPGEGHFMSKLKKDGTRETNKPLNIIEHVTNDHIYLTNERFLALKKDFYLLRPGVLKASKVSKTWKLEHHYAKAANELTKVEIDENDAKNYIYGLNIKVKDKVEGYVTLTYKNIPLGLSKISHHDAKNLYPKGLRKKIN